MWRFSAAFYTGLYDPVFHNDVRLEILLYSQSVGGLSSLVWLQVIPQYLSRSVLSFLERLFSFQGVPIWPPNPCERRSPLKRSCSTPCPLFIAPRSGGPGVGMS